MKSTVEIIQILKYILASQQPERIELVKKFQNDIWGDEIIQDEKLDEILTELAYDFDFYEPHEEFQKESPNFYNDERLDELIKSGVQKLMEYSKTQN